MCAGADAVVGYISHGDARSGRRGRNGLAVVPELRPRPAEARRGARSRPRRRASGSTSTRCSKRSLPRTKLVFIAAPNNPTGTTNERAELDAYFERVPPHVLTVLDQAYFEYVVEADYPDAIPEYLQRGQRVLVLRTFSKIFGLAGLRVGYGIGPQDVVTAIGKVRRAFDVTSVGQEAALASIDDHAEIAQRRDANQVALAELRRVLAAQGFEAAGPAAANFLLVRVGDAEALERGSSPRAA